jgi:hypothetical protein
MTLAERVRLCRTCRQHEAIADGGECADCTNAFLRRTRPERIRTFEPEWLRRSRRTSTGLAKDLTGDVVL